MLKVRLMGRKQDIEWFGKVLRSHPGIVVTEFSDMYPIKGSKRYYRVYAEVNQKNKEEAEENYHV